MPDDRRIPFVPHPLREALYDELHARPFHPVTTPHQITHLAFKAPPSALDEALHLVADLCRRYSVNQPGPGTVSFLQDFGEFTVRWERHMEFYTLTVLRPAPPAGEPYGHTVLSLLPRDWLASLPGEAIAALHLVVGGAELDTGAEALLRGFEGQRLIVSQPNAGEARLWTAFKLHSDGFGRFLIQNRGMSDYQMGRLVQRVYEMETYRLLAQLSIPTAKHLAPELHEMDRQLAEMLARLPSADSSEDERELLEHLSRLSTRLETWRAETNYRFSATRAEVGRQEWTPYRGGQATSVCLSNCLS